MTGQSTLLFAQPASVTTLPPVGGFNQPYQGYGMGPQVASPPYVPFAPQTQVPAYNSGGLAPNPAGPAVVPGPSYALPPAAGSSYPQLPGQTFGQLPVGPLDTYDRTLAPTTSAPVLPPQAGVVLPPGFQPDGPVSNAPRDVIAPIDVYLQENRTGRALFGGTVNSDLGFAGKVILEERDFNIRRLAPGPGFLRGGGEHFRLEAMPGNEVQRYMVSWTQPNLLTYLPYSFSVGGFYYTRRLRDWHEQRGGGRVALGFDDRRGFSISTELRAEDVKLFRPRILGVADLDSALGSNDLYRARLRLARDTRDSPFLSSDGGLIELIFDQAFGEHDFSRGQVNWIRHWTLNRPLDPQAGLRTLTHSWKVGLTGSQTPIFENYYAGGFSTIRGFEFRGASPRESDVEVGGEFMFLGSLEYAMPITADNMLRGVAFVDYGTIEREIEFNEENFRTSLGLGLRLSVPAISPAPFSFDFAYPITTADTDERRIFNFFIGATR